MSTTSTIEIEVAAVSHEDTKATDSKEENGPKHFPLEPLEITEPSVAEHDADTEYPSGVKFWGIFIALCFTLILAGLDGAILATAVPYAQQRATMKRLLIQSTARSQITSTLLQTSAGMPPLTSYVLARSSLHLGNSIICSLSKSFS